MNASRLARFLAQSLALWEVDGQAAADSAGSAFLVRAAPDVAIKIERAPAGSPFRWYVSRHDGPARSNEARMRPCGSLVGVLAALRRALGVERGSSVRIAPGAIEPGDALPRAAADLAARAEMQASSRVREGQRTEDVQRVRAEPDDRVPIAIVTGFLGSGKTTLLARLLRHPAMARTAVIVNEFGEVGLDHDLIETSDESFVRLSTGCLCCQVRSDLVLTLVDLAARRRSGELPRFERVVIETSGLADPAPILQALMADPMLAATYTMTDLIATMDAITGLATLDRHAQSVRQAAVADSLILTKTDLPQARAAELRSRLRGLNPDARILEVVSGQVAPGTLFTQSATRPLDHAPAGSTTHDHDDAITSFCLVREQPVHAVALALFVSALADNCGEGLLRVKGIVDVAERPEQPAVIHGVQHVYHPPQWLERWPSADRRTRMVFIGHDIAQQWTADLLALLDWEVSEQLVRRHPSRDECASGPGT